MGGKSLGNILIIQTAFLGDVILATGLVEKINIYFPEAKIDFLLRKGYESLLDNHPKINDVIAFDKARHKIRNLYHIIRKVRRKKYDLVINVQRYFTTGLITILSRAVLRVGFDKNPISFLFDKRLKHIFDGSHEIHRNHKLIEWFTDEEPAKPRLYPSVNNFENIKHYSGRSYLCIFPASIWNTKQFPEERWIELINRINLESDIYLLGSEDDYILCEHIRNNVNKKVENLCGKLNLLDTAALMKQAVINLVNDSAPMHIASAMNAPVAVFYCSTIPAFGYGPLSDDAQIIEVEEAVTCRPCGIHGRRSCPEGHFNCARQIKLEQILEEVEIRLKKTN